MSTPTTLYSSGTFTVTNNAVNQFTVDAVTGNASHSGTLTAGGVIYGTSGLNINSGKLTIDSSGNVVLKGSLTFGTNLVIDSVGNINSAASLGVIGNATIAGVLNASGGMKIGSTLIDSSGNVSAVPSFASTGTGTFGGMLTANNGITVNGKQIIDSQGNILAGALANVSSVATFSTIDVVGTSLFNGNVSILGATTHTGTTSHTGAVYAGSGALSIDTVGNIVTTGNLNAGVATVSSLNASSANVASGKFIVDNSGNVGIGSAASGAALDVYGANSRIRMRGYGGIEWNSSGGAVPSASIIYDGTKMNLFSSSSSTIPKLTMDNSNFTFYSNPTASSLTSENYIMLTPLGILTVAGSYNVNVAQTGSTVTLTAQTGTYNGDMALLNTALSGSKNYLYINMTGYLTTLLLVSAYSSTGGYTFTPLNAATGTAVSLTTSVTPTTVYVVNSCTSNSGAFYSTSLISAANSKTVVVSDSFGRLQLSA